jgi:hypothetical protein
LFSAPNLFPCSGPQLRTCYRRFSYLILHHGPECIIVYSDSLVWVTKLFASTPSTRICAQPLHLVMWFIFNLKKKIYSI